MSQMEFLKLAELIGIHLEDVEDEKEDQKRTRLIKKIYAHAAYLDSIGFTETDAMIEMAPQMADFMLENPDIKIWNAWEELKKSDVVWPFSPEQLNNMI